MLLAKMYSCLYFFKLCNYKGRRDKKNQALSLKNKLLKLAKLINQAYITRNQLLKLVFK